MDDVEVSYNTYRKCLKEAYKHSFRIHVVEHRMNELSPKRKEEVLDKYILDKHYRIIDGNVWLDDCNMGSVKEWVEQFVIMEDEMNMETYYDSRGKLIDGEVKED